jgi:hypothetical protein
MRAGGKIKKKHNEIFEKDGYIHCLACGDSFTWYAHVRPSKFYTLWQLLFLWQFAIC